MNYVTINFISKFHYQNKNKNHFSIFIELIYRR